MDEADERDDRKDRRLNLRISTATFEAYEELARLESKTVSAVVRDVLDQAAPAIQQLALAFQRMQEAAVRGAAIEALQGVQLYQQTVRQLQTGGETLATYGEILESEVRKLPEKEAPVG